MRNGSLTYNDYKQFLNTNIIFSNDFTINQLQPSSIDLTLSDECYEIKSSFLSNLLLCTFLICWKEKANPIVNNFFFF